MKTIAVACVFLLGCTLVAGWPWDRPTPKPKTTPAPEKKPDVPQWVDVDVKSSDVVEATEFIIETYNAQSNSLYYKKAAQVISARKRVGERFEFEIKLLIGSTSCAKAEAPSALQFCEVDNNGEKEECFYRLIDGSEKPQIVTSTCTRV